MGRIRSIADALRRGIVRLWLLALCGSLAFAAQAAEHRFQVLLDTDNNAATGCAVATAKGTASGIEQAWTTVVSTGAAGVTVTRIERQSCTGTTLGAPSTFAGAGWPAIPGNGASGTAPIETFIPLSSLPVQGVMRALLASTNATGGQDATSSFAVVIGAAPPPPPAAEVRDIPLSRWLVVPLGMLLFAALAWTRKRHPGHSALVVCVVLVAASGLAWAAGVVLDGNIGDWNGIASVAGNAKGSAPVDANIVAVFHQADATNLYFRIDADVRADGAGNQTPVVSAGADRTIVLPASASLDGSASDDGLPNPPGALTLTWSKASGPGAVTFADAHAAVTTAAFSQVGDYVLTLSVDDGALNASDDVAITVDATGNQSPVTHADATTTFPGTPVQVDVLTNDTDPDGDALSVASFTQGTSGGVACTTGGACTYSPNANFTGDDSFTYVASDGHGGQSTGTVSVSVSSIDTTLDAPKIVGAFVSSVLDATKFLYSGAHPVQTGVGAGTIVPRRVAVLRGKVTARDGGVLPGVTVSILGHPEFGQTITRSNGRFDMAVNGGGLLTINYSGAGFLALQKQVKVPWQDYVAVPSVALIPVDARVTSITAGAGVAQLHQASVITDSDGTRHATVLFPSGTTARMVMPDGSTQPMSTMHIRATEFTVGANGPAAMPANLPALSGYTYCVELSADEALAAGAVGVEFSQPVVTYVENFLAFPVGLNVPVGIYDRTRGFWVPSLNGRIVRIVAINGGLADVDTDGDNAADSGLGITTDERRSLASLYAPGQTLWRVPVAHFSPEDSNWPYTIPDDAVAPGDNDAGPDADETQQDPICSEGSIVECENRVLGESVAIVGTPYRLNYRSDRVPGLVAKRTIRLSGASVPASLASIDLHLSVAGRTFDQTFDAGANQQTTFVWDRLDGYGRPTLGGQTLSVKIDYNYPTTYKDPGPQPTTFNSVGGVTLGANPSRQRVAVSQSFTTTIGEGLTDARAVGLGGWTLSGHNVYDANARVAHFGDGSRRRAGSLARTITTIDLPGQSVLFDVEVGPDGSQFVALPHGDRIVRIAPDGAQSFVAGTGTEGFGGDGGPATQALLGDPTGIAVGPDGSLYIAEESNFRVRKVAPDGTISTIAGTGVAGFSGDGGPAVQAQLSFAERIAVAPDSTLYLLDGQRVRRINTDGTINTVAGTGGVGGTGDGGPATAATLNASSLTAAPDGSFYIADFGNHRVRRVDANGIIRTVVDYGADSARPVSVRPTADGSLLVALEFDGATTPRVDLVKPDGKTVTVAGGGPSAIQEGIPATQANLVAIRAVAVGPDGSIFVARGDASSRLLRIGPALPGFEGTVYFIASADASQLYVFDSDGKQLRTLNAVTGAVLFEFGYDGNGALASVTEKTGGIDNVTTIEHDAAGNPTAIAGPFGQRTALGVDTNGFLQRITNPAGEAMQITSDASGRMSTFTDARGKTSTFTFDADGRLSRDADPAGGTQDLAHTVVGDQSVVTRTTALGRTTTYTTQTLAGNTQIRVIKQPDGTQDRSEEAIDAGMLHSKSADGTVVDRLSGPDPRFGMESPTSKSVSIALPSGLTLNASQDQAALLSNALDPLSLLSLADTLVVDGRTEHVAYTAATQTEITTTAEGRTSSLTIDSLGRVVTAQVAGLDPAHITYDNRGRMATFTRGSGAGARVHAFAYDAAGFLQSVTDPLGRVAQFTHDAAGRIIGKTLVDGRVAQFAYDAAGNLTSIAPPGRPAHALTYSDRNELASIVPPAVAGTGATTYAYNLDKQLTGVSQPGGRGIAFNYDAGGRVATRSATSGATTSTDTMSYDSAGRLASVAAASGVTTHYAYDGARLIGRTWSGLISGSVTLTYDKSFRSASESVNGANTVAFAYDKDDLLVGVGSLAIARDPQNGMPTASSVGIVDAAIGHDAFGDVTSYSVKAGASTLYSDTFTRDALGRIAQKSETIGGVTDAYVYAYDTAGQLVGVTKNAVQVESYGYDSNGNRTSATVAGNTIAASYDDQDRLGQYGADTFTYTGAGELLTRTSAAATTAYRYDALGNLLDATLANGTVVAYVADGNNRRVGKKVNGALVQEFLYSDGLRPAVELDGAGAVVSRFAYAGGNAPALMIKGGVVFRIVTDQVGSVRLVVNSATGAIAQRLDYDSFGNVALNTNPGFQPFGFGGGLYDADTGLVRLGARDYDATTGRWTAKDASSFVSGDGNLYRYVRNDPVNLMDADGAMPTQPPSPIDKQLAKLAHWLDDPTDIDIPTDLSPEQTAEVVAKRTARMDLEDKILSKIQKLLRIKENAKISPERIGGSGCGIKGLKAFEFMQFWEPIKMGLEYLKTGEVPTWQDLLEEQVYGHRLPEEERQRQRLEALSA